MSLKIVVLCICSQLFAFVATCDTLRANDSNCIAESRRCETSVAGPEVGEFSENIGGGIAGTTECSKSAVDVAEIPNDQPDVLGSLWLQLPLLPIAFARSSSLPDGPCRKQALRYLRELRNETLWAAQMYDASTKFPEGIIAGHTRHLGNFDLCYNLKATLPRHDDDETPAEEEIAGRYCLVDVEYEKLGLPPVDPMERHELQFDPRGSVWEAIREKGDFRRVKRYLLQLALCVPEVCTAGDIEAALREPFDRAGIKQNMRFNVSVQRKFCQARKDAPEFSVGAKIYWSESFADSDTIPSQTSRVIPAGNFVNCVTELRIQNFGIISLFMDTSIDLPNFRIFKTELDSDENMFVTLIRHLNSSWLLVGLFSLVASSTCWLLVGLFSLVASSTWYDYSLSEYKENDGSTANDLLLCFSARRNFNTMMEVTSGHPALEIINLTRFFYLTLTMIGHRLVEYYATPVMNVSYAEWLYTFERSALVLAGPMVVEGFFSIGGLLVSYTALAELDKRKRLNVLGAIVIRYLRLTPAYALVIFFNMLVLPHLGSGPLWEWKVGLERDSCATNWWANLLYINNYVNPEKICMFQSWYLAVDYHLFVLALLVTYAFWRMPRKLGYPFLVLVILGGCAVPFVNTYWYGVQPLYRGFLYMQEVRDDPYFTGHYVKTHERIPSYFVGVLAGAILYDHGRSPWRLGKVVSRISMFLIVLVLGFWSLLSAHKFFDPNRNPVGLEAALYAAFARAAFAASFGAEALLITAGQGLTSLYNFLTPRWVQPLGRITYGVYLVHSAIQLYAVGVTRTAKQFGLHNAFWNLIPDVAYAFLLALLLALAVEGPFRRIEKRFIMKREKSEPSKEVKAEVKKSK